jgi:UDP-N-acetyl-D-mannosaminuronate dehydrogenase
MADACTGYKIDPFQVYRADLAKPFGYMQFPPSLVKPYYLLLDSDFPLLQVATENMRDRPVFISKRRLGELRINESKRDSGIVSRKGVLVVGMGFKAGLSHLVNLPGLQLACELKRLDQLDVMFFDCPGNLSLSPHSHYRLIANREEAIK